MTTNAVNGVTTTSPTTADRGLEGMRSEDFFKILVSELQQQDPFEPAKTADMISQVSQIRSIELSKNLTDVLSQLSNQQHTAGASDLIGKYVSASSTASDGTVTETAGIVTGVRFDSDGSTVLELDTGQSVPAKNVTKITSAQNASGASTTTTPPATADTAAGTAATANGTAADKTSQNAKAANPVSDLLPWLSMDAGIHL